MRFQTDVSPSSVSTLGLGCIVRSTVPFVADTTTRLPCAVVAYKRFELNGDCRIAFPFPNTMVGVDEEEEKRDVDTAAFVLIVVEDGSASSVGDSGENSVAQRSFGSK